MGDVRTNATAFSGRDGTIERARGSDLSGTGGATDRVLTLSSSPTNLLVFLNGQLLTLTEDYTVSGAGVTFLGIIDDDDFITAEYDV